MSTTSDGVRRPTSGSDARSLDPSSDAAPPLTAAPVPGPIDDALANLANQLADEKDRRREERFLFILAVVCILNVLFLRDVENWAVPLVLLILELIFLSMAAKMLGVDWVVTLIDKVVGQLPFKRGE